MMRSALTAALIVACWSDAAAAEGDCPLVIGVASTHGQPHVFKSYIGGDWRTSASGKTLSVLSPVNETALFEVQVPASPALLRDNRIVICTF